MSSVCIVKREIHVMYAEWLRSEYTARVLLDGEIETSYTKADNSVVVATDTVKNTIYSECCFLILSTLCLITCIQFCPRPRPTSTTLPHSRCTSPCTSPRPTHTSRNATSICRRTSGPGSRLPERPMGGRLSEMGMRRGLLRLVRIRVPGGRRRRVT